MWTEERGQDGEGPEEGPRGRRTLAGIGRDGAGGNLARSGRKKGTSHHFLSPDSVYTAVGKVVSVSFLSVMSERKARRPPGGKSISGGLEGSC